VSTLHPEFEGCDAPGGSGAVPASLRTNVVPAGTINGINTVFSTPDNFIHDGLTNEAVYLRGLRRSEGAGCDYVASESGGVGTGYDTITFAVAPKPGDVLAIDYYLFP